MTGGTPNQRPALSFTEEEWDEVVQWRPFVYKRLAKFGSRVTKRSVAWEGEIGKPTFRWLVSGGSVYGVAGQALMQDLEYRAIEATARAAQRFDPGRGVKFVTYLAKVVDNALFDEFTNWVQGSSAEIHRPLEWADDMAYEEEFDRGDEPSGLEPNVEDALQEAMGALTTKEAWALRMHADGVPREVIQERIGHDHVESTDALIRRAKEKAAAVFDQSLSPDLPRVTEAEKAEAREIRNRLV